MARPKRGGIRNIRDKEIADLNKKISKKKSNIKQRYGVEVDIPRIDPSLKGWELRKAKQKASEFLDRRNAEYQFTKNERGDVFTAKHVRDAKALIKRVNKEKMKASKDLMDKPFTVNGKVVGTVKEHLQMLKYDKQEFIPLQFNMDWFKKDKDLIKWLNRKKDIYKGDFIKRQREQYKRNYLDSIVNVFGDTTETRKLLRRLRNMSADEIYLYTMSEDLRTFSYLYSADEQAQKWKTFKSNWGKVEKIKKK